MDIRQLRYLIALAREKHFTRAAEACCVTQPTLSGRIRQLEDELGVAIVLRGQRYAGLTPEGERVLRWAQRIVEDCDGMRADLAHHAGEPEGRMTIGVIPSALPCAPVLTARMRARFPRVGFTLLSRSSRQIAREVEEFSMDAGVTYIDGEPVEHGLTLPLYRERYRLFLGPGHPLTGRAEISWLEAGAHPLCALTPDMQNRRIIDAAFAEAGHVPQPTVESNSVLALAAHLRAGVLACVLPEGFLTLFGPEGGVTALPLVQPSVEHTVGLLVPDREPQPALTEALLAVARDFPGPERWAAIGAADDQIESSDLRS
jgi:DNA-binding transcriptional LysR family regulator